MNEQNPQSEERRDTFHEEAPRYASLSDYTRVIRRRRLLIALFTIAFGAIALGLSLLQDKTYEAAAQVKFTDPLANLGFINDSTLTQSPNVLAAEQADLVTRTEATKRVQRRLKSDLSPSELSSAVETQVGVQTNLVSITASVGDAELAADIANEYAEAAEKLGTEDQLNRFDTAIDGIEGQIEEIRDLDLEPGEELLEITPLRQQLAQVQVLREAAEPVEIVNRARVPGAPASPATRRNTILGAVLGFVFGLIAAFVRDALDRRLHNAQQVHEDLGVPVLGRVPDSAMGAPGLVRNGRMPMLDSDFEAFRGLRMNLAALGRDGVAPRSVLVTSPLPEEGKSTVSAALASAAAITGQRVLLVECDLRRPVLARRLEINQGPGLSDYLTGKAGPKEILQLVELTNPTTFNGGKASDEAAGSMVVITAGTQAANPAELLVGPRFRAFLQQVAKAYDLVVLDTSPMLAVVDPLEIARDVDGILVCARMQRTTRDQLRAARSALRNIADRPVGAVVTGISRKDPDSYDYYYGY
jgi:capsular exopolysaccharide synthesis family protein